MIRFISGIILSALSGVMILLSFPPYGLWPLAWVGFVPYLYAQYRLFPAKWSSTAPSLAVLCWLGPFLARVFGDGFGPFFQFLGIWIAILVFLLQKERRFIEATGYRWFILQGVINWVGFEMVRMAFIPIVASTGFIGYTQSTQPWLIQAVSFTGIFGLDLIMMLVNFTLAQAVLMWLDRNKKPPGAVLVTRKPTLRWIMGTGIALFVWTGISVIILNTPAKNTPAVRVASIRPAYRLPAHQDTVNTSLKRLEKFSRMVTVAASKGARIIYTPEMLFNFDPQLEYTDQLRLLSAQTGSYLFITYVVSAEGKPWRNESVMLSPDGIFSPVYGKNHTRLIGEPSTPTAGNFPVYPTPFGNLAGMICHDANYTDVARKLASRGAGIIAAPYNEFGGFGEQAWNNALFRAVENRTAIVLSGIATVSAIINPDGRLVALDTDIKGSERILVGDVTAGSGNTFYTKTGDVLGWASFAGMVFFIFFQMWFERKVKKTSKL